MSKAASIDAPPLDMTTNTNHSSTSTTPRSKKIAPPPLRLPAVGTNCSNEAKSNSADQQRRTVETQSCLASSTDDCTHKAIPFVLPVSQRAQILEFLTKTSSSLLVPPQADSKQRRTSNQSNLLRDRQPPAKPPVNDAEWIDFLHSIIQKSLNNDLKTLLDKYKATYFDRVNAPNTTDETIRSSLCAMISEALSTYANPSGTNENELKDEISPAASTNLKRKRDVVNGISTNSLNNQSKFVVSSIVPGRTDGNKPISPRHKKIHRNFSHLFKYVPDKDEQSYLIRQGHLKSNTTGEQICLMLHDEVLQQMDDQDRDLCGISLDDAFNLPESILSRMFSIIQ